MKYQIGESDNWEGGLLIDITVEYNAEKSKEKMKVKEFLKQLIGSFDSHVLELDLCAFSSDGKAYGKIVDVVISDDGVVDVKFENEGVTIYFMDMPKTFKQGDLVLVRDEDFDYWIASRYYMKAEDTDYKHRVNIGDSCSGYRQCIFLKGNEELIGTADKPKEDL